MLYTGESEAIGISLTPIDFIEKQELFMTLIERILWFPPILSNGKMKWDKKRGKLQKIFKTENFVMVTFGTNEFDAGKHNRIRVYLEDWVNANISKYKTPSAFAKGMYSYMNRMNVQVGKNKVAFIAGYREKEMNYWEVIYITPIPLPL